MNWQLLAVRRPVCVIYLFCHFLWRRQYARSILQRTSVSLNSLLRAFQVGGSTWHLQSDFGWECLRKFQVSFPEDRGASTSSCFAPRENGWLNGCPMAKASHSSTIYCDVSSEHCYYVWNPLLWAVQTALLSTIGALVFFPIENEHCFSPLINRSKLLLYSIHWISDRKLGDYFPSPSSQITVEVRLIILATVSPCCT